MTVARDDVTEKLLAAFAAQIAICDLLEEHGISCLGECPGCCHPERIDELLDDPRWEAARQADAAMDAAFAAAGRPW